MKTPFTDASTLIVHAGGKALAVTPASVPQMLERRIAILELSQDSAFGIIKLADWNNQSSKWQSLARDWQENVYVHKELPLAYTPGPRPQSSEEDPKTLPDALKLIAELRLEKHELGNRIDTAEKHLNELEIIITSIENEHRHSITIQQN